MSTLSLLFTGASGSGGSPLNSNVQRGNTVIGSGSGNTDVTITSVDINKTTINLLTNGNYSIASNTYMYMYLLNATTIRITRANITSGAFISWEVIEYA